MTGTKLWIIKLIVGNTILIFNDWQRFQALAEECNLLGMHTDLACLGSENEAFYADNIADIEQFLKHFIV